MAVDILGPLPQTDQNNRFLLVCADYFTKWPEAIPIPDQTAETVADALIREVFCRFGAPLQLHSDQGRNFESNIFQEVLRRFGVEKTRTTALHPQSDGLVERFNRTILDYLAKFVGRHQNEWDRYIPYLMLSYRTCAQDSTQQTPARLLFGREIRLPLEMIMGPPPSNPMPTGRYLTELTESLEEIHEHNRTTLARATRRMKNYYDLRARDRSYNVGDSVWLYFPRRAVGRCPKLQCDWE